MTDAITGITLSSDNQVFYATIQDALDHAQSGDTATVGSGYAGSLMGLVKSVGLTFSAPASVTGIELTLDTGVMALSLAGDAAIQVAGNASDNIISGNAAADTLTGGDGNDTYIVKDSSTVVVETHGMVAGSDSSEFGGRDEIQTSLASFTLTQTNAANVEILRGTSQTGQILSGSFRNTYPVVDQIIGGDGNDTISTTTQDRVSVDGGKGDDVLSAASGDTIIGGAGHDTFSLVGTIGVNIDAVSGETVAGGEGDLINGSNYSGTLGGDYIGAGGNDTVYGNAGDDGISVNVNSMPTLIDGGTNGTGGDRLSLSGHLPGGARATPAAGSITNVEYLVIDNTASGAKFDFSNLTQGSFVSLFAGGVGQGIYAVDVIGTTGDDTLFGSGNGDTLAGGAGNDIFEGQEDDLTGAKITDISTGERIVIRNPGSNFAATFSGTTLSYGSSKGAFSLSLTNGAGGSITTTPGTLNGVGAIETITFTAGTAPPGGGGGGGGGGGSTTSTSSSDGPDELTGTPGDDTLAGLAGGDTINGGDGNDVIYGNQDNDLIDGGPGNNSVYGGMGDDQISAGAGNDLIYGNQGADTINAGDGNNTVVGGQDSTDGADYITTGSGNDLIISNGGNDTISAGGGNDTVAGGFGDDKLLGNQGNDFVYGNKGDDLISGGMGDDTLIGGQGDDTLYGNEGDDLIYGNEGADRLVFGTNSGVDIVQDFSSNEGDRLDLQGQSYVLSQNTQGSAVLTLSGGGTITLAGIEASQVNLGFFA